MKTAMRSRTPGQSHSHRPPEEFYFLSRWHRLPRRPCAERHHNGAQLLLLRYCWLRSAVWVGCTEPGGSPTCYSPNSISRVVVSSVVGTNSMSRRTFYLKSTAQHKNAQRRTETRKNTQRISPRRDSDPTTAMATFLQLPCRFIRTL